MESEVEGELDREISFDSFVRACKLRGCERGWSSCS